MPKMIIFTKKIINKWPFNLENNINSKNKAVITLLTETHT